MADVFLHIGLPKTGTTTIQAALEASRDALAADGVLFPGGTHLAQRRAVYDLLGQRLRGEDRGPVAGSFRRMLDEVDAHRGRSVVISEEELTMAGPRQVRRLVRALGDHDVHVVIGARDMARTLVSAWQQTVVNGGTVPWQDFIASAREEVGAPASQGISFWLRHDLLAVVDTWSRMVPHDRIRVVTLPPRGAPGTELLRRFAEASGLPPGVWDGVPLRERNVSLGVAELEAVRRLNASVAGTLNPAQHRFIVEAGIRARLAGARGRPLVLPQEHLAWAEEQGARHAEGLVRRGVGVVGSLADLTPTAQGPGGCPGPDVLEEGDLLAATEAALTSMALSHGRLFRRYRREVEQRTGVRPAAAELVSSQARAGSFRVRKWVLRQTDQSPVLARAVRAHVEGQKRRRGSS